MATELEALNAELNAIDVEIAAALLLAPKPQAKQAIKIHGKLNTVYVRLQMINVAEPGRTEVWEHFQTTSERLIKKAFGINLDPLPYLPPPDDDFSAAVELLRGLVAGDLESEAALQLVLDATDTCPFDCDSCRQ